MHLAGCDCARYFTGEKISASTFSTVRAEVRFVLHVVALFLLTRFRSRTSAGRNLITVFHSVNKCSLFFSGIRKRRDAHDVALGHARAASAVARQMRRQLTDALKANKYGRSADIAITGRCRMRLHAGQITSASCGYFLTIHERRWNSNQGAVYRIAQGELRRFARSLRS